MHPGQLDLNAETAAALVHDQFPQWRTLPVRSVASNGTVNILFRLGDELVLRFPLEPGEVADRRAGLQGEAEVADWILGRLPVATPEPVALGSPARGYPSPWAVYRWLP